MDANFQDGEGDEAYTPDGEDGAYVWDDSEDTTQDLLSLNEQDFPLVCTFNYFLKLLENTIKSVLVSHIMRDIIIPY